jgi:hypothetical protein
VSRRVHGRRVHVRKRVKTSVAAPLLAPTKITAQDGAVVTRSTQIAVTGCRTAKKVSHRKARPKRRKKK